MYCDIFIENNFNKIDNLYTYIFDKDIYLKPGMRVMVSFGNGTRVGIVLKIYSTYNGPYLSKLKNIIDVLDAEPIISEDLIELGLWMKDRYLLGYSKAFAPLLPPGDLKKIKKSVNIKKYPYGQDLEDLKKINLDKLYEDMDSNMKNLCNKLYKKGILKFSYIPITSIKIKTEKYLKKSKNFSVEKLQGLTKRQSQALNYIIEKKDVSKKLLMKELKMSSTPIEALIKKDLVTEFDREVKTDKKYIGKVGTNHTLNEEQKDAIKSIEGTKKEVSILYGLTGSGKTEVYLNLAKIALDRGEDVIVLVPEIGLTSQMIERFRNKFQDDVAIIHSKLSKGQRYEEYRKILNGDVHIVVGVRSAVFVPFTNCSLIILDEFHDSSYTFHDSLKYDSIEVAIKRMENKGKVVLGSATPDISHYYLAQQGKYNLSCLKNRAFHGSRLPDTKIIDMRKELLMGNLSIFSRALKDKIKEKLDKNEQIILFLNRRGFSNFVSCRTCGHVIKCDNCDISMTYHKTNNRLICHYCGYTKSLPKICPSCGSKYIKQFGLGTQKVEEEVKKFFPNARILRMDKDTTSKKDSYENYYHMIKNKEVDVIIGTQMISKGFDFPDVTLVGVIASDISLYISSYKSSEDTFQLITQVSGRAGRSYKKGDVIIQSYNPKHYAIMYAADNSYEGFYKEELEERRTFLYPPFSKIINLEFSSTYEKLAIKWANAYLYNIGKIIGNLDVQATKIIKLPKIKNVYRIHFSLKVCPQDEQMLLKVLRRVINISKINDKKDIDLNIKF